jgi:hypothetical protein
VLAASPSFSKTARSSSNEDVHMSRDTDEGLHRPEPVRRSPLAAIRDRRATRKATRLARKAQELQELLRLCEIPEQGDGGGTMLTERVVLIEDTRELPAYLALRSRDGRPLGQSAVNLDVRPPQGLSARLDLRDPDGREMLTLLISGGFRRSPDVVLDAAGVEIARLEKTSRWPRRISRDITADGQLVGKVIEAPMAYAQAMSIQDLVGHEAAQVVMVRRDDVADDPVVYAVVVEDSCDPRLHSCALATTLVWEWYRSHWEPGGA